MGRRFEPVWAHTKFRQEVFKINFIHDASRNHIHKMGISIFLISPTVRFSVVQIGSTLWRFRNYGVIPTLRYLGNKNLQSSHNLEENLTILSIEQLEMSLGSGTNLLDFEKSFHETYLFVSLLFDEPSLENKKFKTDIIGSQASLTKFKLLSYILSTQKFNRIVETGTQHGSTSLFIGEVLRRTKKIESYKIYTIDVQSYDTPKWNPDIMRIVLKKPYRKSFKKITSEYITDKDSTLFFHDSDHSYENMMFEFKWAWETLKVKVLIADDVSNNSAFLDFANSIQRVPFVCKFDSGPSVGLLFK